ncbi:MAG: Uma2 family endonuclease [Gemmatimonadota bacterium]|nr:Uma2 family endonuclease [Gemmatimonadota bacterium]
MSTQIQTRPTTAEELLRMPDDGFRYELVAGELKKMNPAGGQHGRVAMTVGLSLAQHVRANDLGTVYAAETGFRIASHPDTVRAPDAAFVRKERAEAMGDVQGYLPGAPDLAVEVVSPGDSYSEVVEKAFDWLEAGARLVVVVDPRRRNVTLYRSREEIRVLSEEDLLDGVDVVPGWKVPVRELFG